MQEAKYSLNIRLELGGYNAQLTIRSDESWEEVVTQMKTAVGRLGQGPAARPGPEAKPRPVPVAVPQTNGQKPLCPGHGRSQVSRYGGYFCPAPTEYDGQTGEVTARCKWTAKDK